VLCSESLEEDGAQELARYILAELKKGFRKPESLGGLRGALQMVCGNSSKPALFADLQAAESLQQLNPGSLAFEHLIQSVQEAYDQAVDGRFVLRRFSEKAFDRVAFLASVQGEYGTDQRLQSELRHRRPETIAALVALIEECCGIRRSIIRRSRRTVSDILDVVLVRQ
jgi:hypothetical protein